jgi:hypothetical protein
VSQFTPHGALSICHAGIEPRSSISPKHKNLPHLHIPHHQLCCVTIDLAVQADVISQPSLPPITPSPPCRFQAAMDSRDEFGEGPSTSAAAAPPPPPSDPLANAPPQDTELYSYVVTAHRPSAVAQSATAAFTADADINLIISKVTRMEIHRLTEDGLQGIADVPIYGRIACMRVRPPPPLAADELP